MAKVAKCILSIFVFPVALLSQHPDIGVRISLHSSSSPKDVNLINSRDNLGMGVFLLLDFPIRSNFSSIVELGGGYVAFPKKTTTTRTKVINSTTYLVEEEGVEFVSDPTLGVGVYPKLNFLSDESLTQVYLAAGPGFYIYPITSEHSFIFHSWEEKKYVLRFTPGLRLGLQLKLSETILISFQTQADAILGLEPEPRNDLVNKKLIFWGAGITISARL